MVLIVDIVIVASDWLSLVDWILILIIGPIIIHVGLAVDAVLILKVGLIIVLHLALNGIVILRYGLILTLVVHSVDCHSFVHHALPSSVSTDQHDDEEGDEDTKGYN